MNTPNDNSHLHTIRLRRPWEKTLTVNGAESGPSLRVDVPEPDGDLPHQSAKYTRRFNRPTSLTDRCLVRLEIQSWQGDLVLLQVNDHRFPVSTSPVAIDVTEVLRDQNLICIQIDPQSDCAPRLNGAIQLVIQSSATS